MSIEAHKRRLGALFDEAWDYFQEKIPAHTRQAYVEDIQHLGFNVCYSAFCIHRTSPPPPNQVKRPPRPVDILSIVALSQRPIDEANEMASRIWGAIGSLGYNKSSEVVRAAIGDKAWEVVRQMGGNWRGLCESVMECDQTTWMAQLRDKSHAVLNKWDQMGVQMRMQAAHERDRIQEAKAKGDYPKLTSVNDVLRKLPQAQPRQAHDG
jgi:hypothetical protein